METLLMIVKWMNGGAMLILKVTYKKLIWRWNLRKTRRSTETTICFFCGLHELGRKNWWMNVYGYKWEAPEKRILLVVKREYALKLKSENHYYKVSQNHTGNMFFLKVKKDPRQICNKRTLVYPTSYEPFCIGINYSEFDMENRRNVNGLGLHLLQYLISAAFSEPGKLYVYCPQHKTVDPYINTWLILDYELQKKLNLTNLSLKISEHCRHQCLTCRKTKANTKQFKTSPYWCHDWRA